MKVEITPAYTHMAHRIKCLIDYLGVTPNQFAKQMGYERSDVLYNVIKFKNYPSYELLYRILSSVENLSASWLLKGEGDMIASEPNEIAEAMLVSKLPIRVPIPVYDVVASAGTEVHFCSGERQAIDYLTLGEEFYGCDAAVRVYGDSMCPMYQSGDLVVLKHIKEINYIQWGYIYLVITRDNCLLKYIGKSDKANKLLLKSHNEYYEPFELDRKDILELYEVRGFLRKTGM